MGSACRSACNLRQRCLRHSEILGSPKTADQNVITLRKSKKRPDRPRVALLVKIAPLKLGSMEDWLIQLVASLVVEFEVAVATYSPCHPDVLRSIKEAGASWHDLAKFESSTAASRRWFEQHADLTHFSLFAPRGLPVLAAQSLGLPVIFQDCHSSPFETPSSGIRSRILDWLTFRRVHSVVAVSKFVADRLQRRFSIAPPKLKVAYNGVDVSRFSISPPPSECDGILCVASLIPEKGVDLLIRAFAALSDCSCVLKICGDGRMRMELEALTIELGVANRVQFLGLRNDVHQLLTYSAIAVHPAIWGEAFGLTIVEAMAASRPVVGFRVGAVSELIVDGITGITLEPGNVQELTLAMSRLIADPSLRDQLGISGRKRVEEMFSMNSWVETHARCIRESFTENRRSD